MLNNANSKAFQYSCNDGVRAGVHRMGSKRFVWTKRWSFKGALRARLEALTLRTQQLLHLEKDTVDCGSASSTQQVLKDGP